MENYNDPAVWESMATTKYTPQQEALIHAPVDRVAIGVAGAGTGKTTTILGRAAHLLNTYDTKKLLLVTFTRAAANELRERFQKEEPELAHRVIVGTFHSVLGNLIRETATEVGLSPAFSILDEASTTLLFQHLLEQNEEWGQRFLRWVVFKDGVTDPEKIKKKKCTKRHYSFLAGLVSLLINTATPEEVFEGKFTPETHYLLSKYHKIFQGNYPGAFGESLESIADWCYELFKESLKRGRETNTITYDHILFIGYLLVRNGKLDTFKEGLLHTIVDEYQDTNRLQDAFVREVAGNRLTIVGDIDQSIYQFRGGKPSLMLEHAKEGTVYHLSGNYRSGQEILDLANQVIRNNEIGSDIRKPLEAKRTASKSQSPIQVVIAPDDRTEAEHIIEEIKQAKENGIPYEKQCILIRSRMVLPQLSRYLGATKIPVNDTTSFADFLKSEVMTDTLNYLKVYVNPKDIYAFLGMIDRPKQGIGPAAIEKLEGFAKKQGMGLIDYLLSKHPEKDLTPALKKKIATFVETYTSIIEGSDTKHIGLKNLVEYLYASFGYDTWLYTLEKKEKYRQDIALLKSMITDYEESRRDENLSLYDLALGFVLDITASTRQESKDGVVISTVHNAKGLEWQRVYLVGLEEENFPGTKLLDSEDLESERRLVYVAMTRARDQLYLYASRSRITWDDPLTPSRFLSECTLKPEQLVQLAGREQEDD